MKRGLLLFLACALIGCPGGQGEIDERDVSTPLSGTVHLSKPVVGATIEIFDYRTGAVGARYAQAETDGSGRWKADVGHRYGDYLIKASGGGLQAPLNAIVAGVKVHDGRNFIAITPVTHLQAAYGTYLVKQGASLASAAQQAQDVLNSHLGGINHEQTVPWAKNEEEGGAVSLSAPVKAHLITSALEHLATRVGRASASSAGFVNLQTLTEALAEDVGADGIFDGRGEQGQVVYQATTPITGDTMRADLAVSLIRFAEQPNLNKTGLTASDLRSMAAQIAATQSPIFPTTASSLYLTPPNVNISVPSDRAIINKEHDFVCTADTEIDIASIQMAVFREGKQLDALLMSVQDKQMQGGHGRLAANLQTQKILDGQIELICTATDRNDNYSEARSTVLINNHAAKVSVMGVEANQTVKGLLDVSCKCEDDAQSTGCHLVSPPFQNLMDLGGEIYRWDTRQAPEGPFIVTCRSSSPGLPAVTAQTSVFVDNQPNGHVCGHVFLDSPVQGAEIMAYTYAQGMRGEKLGATTTATDVNGQFCVEVLDIYTGPILLTAGGAGATYRNGVSGSKSQVSGDLLQLVIDSYVPNQSLEGLSINALSTLGVHLIGSCLQTKPFADCSQKAHRDLAEHLGKPSLDVRRVAVRDFVTDGDFSALNGDDFTILGLIHVGLSRLGAEVATNDFYYLEKLLSAGMLEKLVFDAADGHFDGRDSNGRKINLTPATTMTAETFRSDLAGAISRWLNNLPLKNGITPASNRTSLRAVQFSQAGGLLRVLSGDTGRQDGIFPADAPPPPYDEAGPKILVQGETLDGQPLELSQPQSGKFALLIIASDEQSGVEALDVTFDSQPSALEKARGPQAANQARFYVDTTQLKDGVHILRVEAWDGFGNATAEQVAFVSDNSVPTVSLVDVPQWTNGKTPLRIHGKTNKPIKSVHISSQGAMPRVLDDFGHDATDFEVSYEIPCLGQTSIHLSVVDRAGNTASVEHRVFCDDKAPTHSWLASPFHQENPQGYSYNVAKQSLIYSAAQETAVDLTALPQPAQIVKYFNRLDYLPLKQIEPNLPTLRFNVMDDGASQAAPLVTYTYRINDQIVRQEVPLAGNNGAYALPFSYQTLDAALGQTTPDDVNTVEFQAVDQAGNVTQFAYSFQMKLLAPPAVMSGCTVHPDLKSHELANMTMHYLFQTTGSAKALQGNFAWLPGLDPESQASQDAVSVVFRSSGLRASIDEVRFEKEMLPGERTEQRHMWCEGLETRFRVADRPHDPLNCFVGPFPHFGVAWTPPPARLSQCLANTIAGSPVSSVDVTSRTHFQMQTPAGIVLESATGEFFVGPDQKMGTTMSAETPRLILNGSVFSWAPWTSNIVNQPRYRIDAFEGEERVYHRLGHEFQQVQPVRYSRYISAMSLQMSSAAEVHHPRYGTLGVIVDPTCQWVNYHSEPRWQ